jgi:hypothetical protein
MVEGQGGGARWHFEPWQRNGVGGWLDADTQRRGVRALAIWWREGLAGGKTRPRRHRIEQLEKEPACVGKNKGGRATDGWGHLAQYRRPIKRVSFKLKFQMDSNYI